mmetsp:Transcript_33426/g.108144  ORF Transcript_33426/g.108144 Transcript_33426/m.108144 type:complete len:215 (-) Transcript_33426:984-1628(-)
MRRQPPARSSSSSISRTARRAAPSRAAAAELTDPAAPPASLPPGVPASAPGPLAPPPAESVACRCRTADGSPRVSRSSRAVLSSFSRARCAARSYGRTPTSVNKSASMQDLILRSSGASADSEGDRFTSSSHGLRASSISTSKPSISKQAFFCAPAESSRRWAAVTEGSTAMSALSTRSSIRRHRAGTSTPLRVRHRFSAESDHLFPWSSAEAS